MPWQSQSPDLMHIDHLEILEWRLRQRFPPPSTKHQIMEFIVEGWCRTTRIEFQTLVESMSRRIEAVLACGGPTPYTLCWCFLYFGNYIYIHIHTETAQPPYNSCHHNNVELSSFYLLAQNMKRYLP